MRLDEDFIKKNGWFHSIDFGNGLISPPRSLPPNWTLYGVFKFIENIKVEGMECLDIGTFDGLTAFILKKLGAATVTATDIFNLPTFTAGREHFGLDIEYIPGMSLESMYEKMTPRKFDIVVMAGVLYHLYGPLLGIAICRKLVKREGLVILETETYNEDKSINQRPLMLLNSEANNFYNEAFTYWRPTVRCVVDMLKMCCFEPIAVTTVNQRTTFLARAKVPGEISNTQGALDLIHSQKIMTPIPEYLHFQKMNDDQDFSKTEIKSSEFPERIVPEEFFSSLPFLPSK